MRNQPRQVIDIQTLANGANAANSIHQALLDNQGIEPQAAYTSAEFALEMIQGVQRVDYTIRSPLEDAATNAGTNEVSSGRS